MALNICDVDWDEEDGFASVTKPFPKVKPLDYSYQGLLEERNKLVLPNGASKDMTEDELLLNTNLQVKFVLGILLNPGRSFLST